MGTLRADRPLWMSSHFPLVQKYQARVAELARQHGNTESGLRRRLSKLSVTFEDFTK